jgi:hypothetical protein
MPRHNYLDYPKPAEADFRIFLPTQVSHSGSDQHGRAERQSLDQD